MSLNSKYPDFLPLSSFDTNHFLAFWFDRNDKKFSHTISSKNELLCKLFNSPSVSILYVVYGNGDHLMDIRGEDKLGEGCIIAHRYKSVEYKNNIFFTYRSISSSNDITKAIIDELHQYFDEFEKEFTIKN